MLVHYLWRVVALVGLVIAVVALAKPCHGWTTAMISSPFIVTPRRMTRQQQGPWWFLLARHNDSSGRTALHAEAAAIDYQSNHGRGEHHLTAALQPGDVVVYQIGTWYVDGVQVGNGQPAAWDYCLVDTLQIVWSHNCEHGVVRGFALKLQQRTSAQQEHHDSDTASDDNDSKSTTTQLLQVHDFNDMIDFGPEQLVARIPVEQFTEDTFRSLVELSDDLWQVAGGGEEDD